MKNSIIDLPLGIDHCYLVKGESYVLIDGGAPKKFKIFQKALREHHIQPKEIGLIILTHAHWDHIGSLRDIRDFTGAKVLVHKLEAPIVKGGLRSMPHPLTMRARLLSAVMSKVLSSRDIAAVDTDIEMGAEFSLVDFGIDGTVIHTPGHSSGSVSIVIDSEAAFVGDMAMNGFPFGFHIFSHDFAESHVVLEQSWRKLLKYRFHTIYPAHGRPFAVERVKKRLFLKKQPRRSFIVA